MSNKVVDIERGGFKMSQQKLYNSNSPLLDLTEQLADSQDILAEELLKNVNTSPLGQLLKKIAALPEIRQEKVVDVRSQLQRGDYDLNKRLDLALDRVLEELIKA
ncbi:MAG: hypothetical protein A2Y07_04710 [Planctomycetes bacterium GWF2_50_10]|nr:MAG: hypothetical protein A2Y07_04710 [Planctomycetes bacterium GWF2_50_10]